MRIALWIAATIVLTAGAARAQAPSALTADTPRATAAGATFTAPKAWSLSASPALVVLAAPEGDSRIALVDVKGAPAAAAAMAAAWRAWRPAASRPLRLATARAARNGWDEEELFDYETSPNEHLLVDAVAFRSGANWTVAIEDGSQSTFEKREAAARLVFQSLRPAGYRRESFAGRVAHPMDAARVAALRSFVEASMARLGVPGAGLAIIDHGKVVFEGGLGVRELGKPTPVDADTLFMIASNTKGMSTLLLASLVDQGKLAWDEPVTKVYPPFRLGSPETTRQVLIRHLVCACTGLPRKDLDWIFDTRADTPASATFDELAATQPTSGFGEAFQYNNLMAAAAGYIGGHLVHPDRELGAAYDAAMAEQIFAPLGMNETTFDMARALSGDHASPHGDDIDGRPTLASMDFNHMIAPYRPAGGAWSSAHDLIRYVGDELSDGRLADGRRLVSAKNLLLRRAPSVPTGEEGSYGMGLEIDTTWGVTVIHHGGSMAGFKSDIVFVPAAGVGAVILTNADDGRLMLRPFMRRMLEILYDGKSEAAGDVAVAAARNQAEIAKDRERLVLPPAPALAAGLAGAYTSRELGRITVRREGAGVVFDFGAWKSRVASRRNDDGTVSFITIDPTVAGFEFVVSTRGGKRALIIRDGQHEYLYTEAG
ncbi:MAG TPA: serine hydrolase domain-containing protein [Caulobacteraceae bacterium]